MVSKRCRSAFWGFWAGMLVLTLPVHLLAESTVEREGKIKSALLFHVSQFIRWPVSSQAPESFRLCTTEGLRFLPYLRETFEAKLHHGRAYKVLTGKDIVEQPGVCSMVVVESLEALPSRYIPGASVVVALSPPDASRHVDVFIHDSQNRVAVALRAAKLKKRGFSISSELLQVATLLD